MVKTYGIYLTDGKKLKNSDEILNDKNKFWGGITKSVLDRIPNNAFGILLHPLWMNGELYWIVRESKKYDLKLAVFWCENLFKCRYK